MTQQTITKTEDIVVEKADPNEYGDLIVTDKVGKEHKIGKKRSSLFPVFTPGTAVHLSYSVYMNKEYIANATPLDQMIKVYEPEPTKQTNKQKTGVWNRPDNTASIETQVAAKIGSELLSTKIIDLNTDLGKATINWCLKRLCKNEPSQNQQRGQDKAKAIAEHLAQEGITTSLEPDNLVITDYAAPKIIQEHYTALVELLGKGDNKATIKNKIKEYGWSAKTIKELTDDQAARLIEELAS